MVHPQAVEEWFSQDREVLFADIKSYLAGYVAEKIKFGVTTSGVSSDFRGNAASSIIDGLSTVVLEGKMAKVLSWYDNEWGYSCRVGDLARLMATKGL